jgi:hypothetical protein
MVLLGGEAEVEARFGPFRDRVSVGAWFALIIPSAYKLFWMHMMELVSELVLVYLEIVLILMQDKYIVCAEHTRGSKIIFDTPDGTPR